eukprot:COSAG02_NODE_819_length_16803_cov_6.292924_20_plen_58_part_00
MNDTHMLYMHAGARGASSVLVSALAVAGDADDDAALAWGLAVAALQRRDSAIAQVDW